MGNVRFPQYKKLTRNQKDLSRDIAKSAMGVYLGLSMAILADKFGFGETRLNRFKEYYLMLCESIGTGQDDFETIRKNIKEMFGIEV